MTGILMTRFSLALIFFAASHVAYAGHWIFLPSTYSHSPVTGERVRQYAPIPPVIVYERADFTRSGYRQSRSTIRAGGSADNYHIVEQFGDEIRPYGEWLYPHRPYAVPYDIWGPPYGGVNGEYYGDAAVRGDRRDYDRRWDRDDHDRDHRGHRDREYRGYDYRERDDLRDRGEEHFDASSRRRGRYNGLFDGRGIPGDDEHYLDPPRHGD